MNKRSYTYREARTTKARKCIASLAHKFWFWFVRCDVRPLLSDLLAGIGLFVLVGLILVFGLTFV
jgi:hypothetical protein